MNGKIFTQNRTRDISKEIKQPKINREVNSQDIPGRTTPDAVFKAYDEVSDLDLKIVSGSILVTARGRMTLKICPFNRKHLTVPSFFTHFIGEKRISAWKEHKIKKSQRIPRRKLWRGPQGNQGRLYSDSQLPSPHNLRIL